MRRVEPLVSALLTPAFASSYSSIARTESTRPHIMACNRGRVRYTWLLEMLETVFKENHLTVARHAHSRVRSRCTMAAGVV